MNNFSYSKATDTAAAISQIASGSYRKVHWWRYQPCRFNEVPR